MQMGKMDLSWGKFDLGELNSKMDDRCFSLQMAFELAKWMRKNFHAAIERFTLSRIAI